MVDIIGLNYNALVFREFLRLESSFMAFDGFPVNKERRYYIRNEDVQCHHPYWPEASILRPTAKDWKKRLEVLNTDSKTDLLILDSMALDLATVLKGYWSVDFAKAKDGKWYFIDCALGDASYHSPLCKHSKMDGNLE
jgi:hypothetical protein